MNRPIIRVSQYVAKLPREGNDAVGPRERRRWRAELLNESCKRLRSVEGFVDRDQAIGALVRDIAAGCTNPIEAVDLVAGIFGDTQHRPVDVTLGRAIRLSLHRRRNHPGVLLEFVELPPNVPTQQLAETKRANGFLGQIAAKGGAR